MSTQLSNPTSLASASDKPAAARIASLGWLLPFHALVWTLAAWLARGNLDIQGDMVETYVWGIEWQAGYAKHPPLSSWVAAAWFSVFPHTDLAYFALSAVNVLVGLAGIVALAGRFVPRPIAIIAGLAMAVSPLYSNLAIKFNPNSILLSVWPWTAYFFVRYGSRAAASRAAARRSVSGRARRLPCWASTSRSCCCSGCCWHCSRVPHGVRASSASIRCSRWRRESPCWPRTYTG
ncbi:glycosyltransferase family 39 protein [Paraburkholderia sp. CI3]|uniref:glycosyltransferase family 39 protein n=1 Tax=Paraburkholderia sp. CI3 TaxID=2991060 RepID=UPI003D21F2D3